MSPFYVVVLSVMDSQMGKGRNLELNKIMFFSKLLFFIFSFGFTTYNEISKWVRKLQQRDPKIERNLYFQDVLFTTYIFPLSKVIFLVNVYDICKIMNIFKVSMD